MASKLRFEWRKVAAETERCLLPKNPRLLGNADAGHGFTKICTRFLLYWRTYVYLGIYSSSLLHKCCTSAFALLRVMLITRMSWLTLYPGSFGGIKNVFQQTPLKASGLSSLCCTLTLILSGSTGGCSSLRHLTFNVRWYCLVCVSEQQVLCHVDSSLVHVSSHASHSLPP